MKSRIAKLKTECVLSVGMIVKNEEKYLDKCLSALKPLLDSVKSELVIVDTGSTDNTVEIAKKYTDKIYFFEWINDFAAARNFGLEKCVGEWFMYIDADEILDADASDLIGFFSNSELCVKYNSATYIINNYMTADGKKSMNTTVARIVRRTIGLRFNYPIHEALNEFSQPHYLSKTVFHHWGYAYEKEDAKNAKNERNLSLLIEELKKHPNNLHRHLHFLNEVQGVNFENALDDALKKARKQTGDVLARAIFARAAMHYYDTENYKKSIEYINEYFKLFSRFGETVLLTDIYVVRGAIYEKIGQKDAAIEAFEKYFRLYDLHRKGELEISELSVYPITYIEPERYIEIRHIYDRLTGKTAPKTIKFDEGTTIRVAISSGVVLSVGMIVKNEEKYLEKCLCALKPLLDAVPSELVIVDTGSNDGTVEIAKKYTDKIYFFDWIGDFSAARNFGLKKCIGEWFMFIDADEIFDNDLSEIINFFKDESLCGKYNCASYTIKNFSSTDSNGEIVDFTSVRIGKLTNNLHFDGEIHEMLNVSSPCYELKTFANHYGYAFGSKKEFDTKKSRNYKPLLREIDEKPNDIRPLLHILPIADESEIYLTKMLELARKNDNNYCAPAFLMAIRSYAGKNDFDMVIELIDEYEKLFKRDDALIVDIYYLKGAALSELGRYGEAADAFEKYLVFYRLNQDGKLNRESIKIIFLENFNEDKYFNAKISCCEAHIRSGNNAEAQEFINKNIICSDIKTIVDSVDALIGRFTEYENILLKLCESEYFTKESGGLLWAVSAYARAVTGSDNELLFDRFCNAAASYTADLYNAELLNEDDVSALPELHRFGYYCNLLLNKEKFDIETAIFDCPSFAKIIRRKT